MSIYERKQASDEELKFLDRIFASAIFTVKPDGYYDDGTRVRFIQCMYLIGNNVPCALVCGLRGGKEDEEISSFDEFVITWDETAVGGSSE